MLKKILSIILVVACLLSLVACGNTISYEYGPISGGANANDSVKNNGNYLVQKGNYIYFINSAETSEAENNFEHKHTNGAIIRANLDGSNQTLIFPKVVTNGSKVGLYIFGDTIYFTSPCDQEDGRGVVQKNYLDIMSVKLDGTNGTKHATLASSNYPMTFIEEDGVVYLVYVKNGEFFSLDLSKNSKSKSILTEYESYIFADNKIIFSMLANVEGSDKIKDTYSEVYSLSAKGDKTKLFSGLQGGTKYRYSINGIEDGKLYYSKNDGVKTLENSLCYCVLSNPTKEFVVTKNVYSNFVKYSYGANNGYIVSDSSVGVVFFTEDFSTVKKISDTVLTIAKIEGKNLFYTTSSENAVKLYMIDVDKAINEGIDKVEKVQVLKFAENDYDEVDTTIFGNITVVGDNVFYYSKNAEKAKFLHKWNMSTDLITLAGVE